MMFPFGCVCVCVYENKYANFENGFPSAAGQSTLVIWCDRVNPIKCLKQMYVLKAWSWLDIYIKYVCLIKVYPCV